MHSPGRHGRRPMSGRYLSIVAAIASTLFGLGSGPACPAAAAAARGPGSQKLSEPAPQPAQESKRIAKQVRGQLRASGRWLVYPDGSRFRWRGVTGFMLNEQVSSGRHAEAAAFLEWANRTGFNVVRVLVMLPKGWFTDKDFTPEEGLAALSQTLALARGADMYVEATVLANTASLPAKVDFASYVERAGRICAVAGNCALVEVANEFFHQTQRADVHDPATLASWARRVPGGIPTAVGAPPDERATLVASTPVITIHLERRRDRWDRVRRVSELGTLSTDTNRFVIDNEPMGADEVERPGTRDNLPDVFFAQGALSRVFEVGSNFHFEDGLRAKVPGPIQQRCADAFIAGTRIVNDSYMLTFQNAGWPYSPVRSVRRPEGTTPTARDGRAQPGPEPVVAAYAGLTQVFPKSAEPSSVLLLIGVEGEPGIEWRAPWRKTGVIADLPNVKVWSIGRTQ